MSPQSSKRGKGKDQKGEKRSCTEKRYSCELCGKTFTRSLGLEKHSKRHRQNQEKPYSCEHCGKTFSWISDLNRHMFTHTGERRYTCEYCQKKFSHNFDLRRHTRIHTGDKTYSCEYCGKTLGDAHGLTRHKRRHTGEKPYSCDICGMRFTRSYTVKLHQVVHTGKKSQNSYMCEYCGDTFTQTAGLIGHKRIHTGEKPFSCKHCGKSFTFLSCFQRHKCVGENPFSCHNCGKRFSKGKFLKSHDCPLKRKIYRRGVIKHHSRETTPVSFSSGPSKPERKSERLVSSFHQHLDKKGTSTAATKPGTCAEPTDKENHTKLRKRSRWARRGEDFSQQLSLKTTYGSDSKFTFLEVKEESCEEDRPSSDTGHDPAKPVGGPLSTENNVNNGEHSLHDRLSKENSSVKVKEETTIPYVPKKITIRLSASITSKVLNESK